MTAQNFFVIDGQQRLQSFYIGLCASFGGKKMFFNLYSDFQKGEYDFKFAKPTQGVTEPHKRKHIEANIRQFYRAIFE
ncbi:MAG: hypothetical protein IJ774_12300 [Selenomonadaceae bacterium]|nr:hypothetical protein [Selenomonadaceae bacterium]